MAATALVEIGGLIEARPGVSGGRPCIRGTGLTVARVAYLSISQGLRPEGIIEETGAPVSLASIHAALAYYYENQAVIDADVAERQRVHDELAAAAWPTSLANRQR